MVMKVFAVGDVLTALDVNEYLVNTRFVSTPSDTPRNTTTTLANDPYLSVAVDANKSYRVDVAVNYQSPSASNFKCTFTVPASAAFSGSDRGFFVSTGAYGEGSIDAGFPVTATFHLVGQAPFDSPFRLSGILATAGTAGSFTFQWCQDTSGGTNTIVRAGSSMLLRRCA